MADFVDTARSESVPDPVNDASPGVTQLDVGTRARQAWMATLACAPEALLDQLWRQVEGKPAYGLLRKPEAGLVMVRARAGGSGAQFNLGEMTVTRCTVRVAGRDGAALSGTAYVAGRSLRKAQIAAIVDAMLQDPARHDAIRAAVIAPLQAERASVEQSRHERAASTKVEFFTMVRGE